jgi:hypothetical protein
MTKQEILAELDKEGIFWCHRSPDIDLDILTELEGDDIITTVTDAGINFMNGDYCYIRKGNPDKVGIKVEGNDSWLEKGQLP